jgi:DNA-directed RNA polymerase subunit M/transcription elongation factor TFIIS
MKYCSKCGNALVPKGEKKLYCNICEKEYNIKDAITEEYISNQKVSTKEESETKIVSKDQNDLNEEISNEDRNAKEAHFGVNEET